MFLRKFELGKKEAVLSVDIETSGANLETNSLLSIGAVITDRDLKELDSFYVTIQLREGTEFEESCFNEFWLKNPVALESVQKNPLPPDEAMLQFVSFLKKSEEDYNVNVIVTDNPSFDISWINLYLAKFTDRQPLGYNHSGKYGIHIIDVHTEMHTLCGVLGYPKVYGTTQMKSILDITEKEGWTHSHHALSDARYIAYNYWKSKEKILELYNSLQYTSQSSNIF